ncbi:MAG TPA: lysylphosphatidylglycerol synthase domain-containing protein [Gaiellaceae bacterium]|nr:lysylphosphatidylglycerol synthase domain-containing protein [Gaiellaceae bacterium]
MASEQIFGVDRKRALLALAAAALLGFGALALISQATSFGQAAHAVAHANKAWFAGLVGGELVAYAGYTVGYRTIARACGGLLFPYRTTLQLVIASFGAYVIASSAGGLGVDYWALHHGGDGPHRAGRRVLGFNILEWAMLGAFASAAAVVELVRGGSSPLAMTLAWLVVTPAATAAALWTSAGARGHRLASLPRTLPAARGILTRSRLRWLASAARAGFADAIGALVFLRMLLGRPLRYGSAPLGFALYWLGDLFTLYAGLRALGGDVGGAALVLAYSTGYVVTSSPLPAGAAGFAEASTAYSLHAVGVPLGTAILTVVLYRVFTFWLPIAPALALLPRVRALADRLPETPREADPPCTLELERAAG